MTTTTATATIKDDSLAAVFAGLDNAEQQKILSNLGEEGAKALLSSWEFWSRSKQRIPNTHHSYIVLSAGRGWGKGFAGSNWIVERVKAGAKSIALVAPTKADCRDLMIEGNASAIMNIPATQGMNVKYSPSKRRLEFVDFRCVCTAFALDEVDQIRGWEGDTAWIDELAKGKKPAEGFNNVALGLRKGPPTPRCLISTTPRPIAILRRLKADPDCLFITGSTIENERNLAPAFLRKVYADYGGSNLGRQELDGILLDEADGAIFRLNMIEPYTVKRSEIPPLKKIVTSVDPSGTARDTVGILCLGIGEDGHFYFTIDNSLIAGPSRWSSKVVQTYQASESSELLYESNYGKDLLSELLKSASEGIKLNLQDITVRGDKASRCQNLIARMEQGKVHIVEDLENFIDEMVTWIPGSFSPGRIDSASLAFNHLFKKTHKIAAVAPPVEDLKKPGGSLWRPFGSDYRYIKWGDFRGD